MKRLLTTMGKLRLKDLDVGDAMLAQVRRFSMILVIMAGFAFQPARAAGGEEGIALAIVYDTSGSMKDSVPAGPGKTAPKYVIANKALIAIVDRINQFATNAPANAPRKIEAGLFIFKDPTAVAAVPFGLFNPDALKRWVRGFSQPAGNTPLGNAIDVATKAVLASKLTHKHVVVITDGMNTSGPKPEAVMPRLKKSAATTGGDLAFHFVAFDVDAKVFEPVKKLGATVLAAASEPQLNAQLGYIFEHKILLEDEEPRPPAAVNPK